MKQQLDDLLDALEAFAALSALAPSLDTKKLYLKYQRRANMLKAAAQITETDSTRRALLAEVQGIERVFGKRQQSSPRSGRPIREYAKQELLLMAILVSSGQRPASAARTVRGLLRKRGNNQVTANAIQARWSKSKPNLSTLPPPTQPLRLGDLLRLEKLI